MALAVEVVGSGGDAGAAALDADPTMSFWVAWALGDGPAEPSAADVMSRVESVEAEMTRLLRAQARDLQVVRGLRRSQQQREHGPDAPAERLDVDGWVATEAGVALGLSETQVRDRLAFADALDRYPAVDALAAEGGAPAWTLQRLCEHLDELGVLVSGDELAQAQEAAVEWVAAGRRTVAQLNRHMRRLVLRARARAGGAGDRARDGAHADRDVRARSLGDGTAEIWARLPDADALAVVAALRAGSTRARAAGDPRTLAQLRADGLTAAVTGRPGLYGMAHDMTEHAAGRPSGRTVIDVVVPMASLSGEGDDPGEVAGFGPVPPQTVLDLMAHPSFGERCQVRGLLVDADTGHLVGLAGDLGRVHWVASAPGGGGYRHPAVADQLAQARDGTCRAPGCTRPASACDTDHLVPWPDGPTTLPNTAMLCRYHHRLKTHAVDWEVDGRGDGDLVWITPSGRRSRTRPVAHPTGRTAPGGPTPSDAEDDPPPF